MGKNNKHRKFLIIGALIAAPFLVLLTFNLTLATDCSQAWCGDGVCQSECGETHSNCPYDCPDPCKDIWCGDGICQSECGETASNCPQDCYVDPCESAWCGDGICQSECGETASNCPQDCYVDPCESIWCGDGICQSECGETQQNCPYDCGEPCNCTSWSSWQNIGCGQGSCSATQMLQKRTRTCTPSGCNTQTETKCISHSSCVPDLNVTCSASPNPAQINQVVEFTAYPSGGTGSYTYAWSGACTCTCETCTNSFSQAGTYTAKVKVTSGSQTKEASCSVTIAPGVSTDLKANNSNGPITVSYKSNVVLSWTSENRQFK